MPRTPFFNPQTTAYLVVTMALLLLMSCNSRSKQIAVLTPTTGVVIWDGVHSGAVLQDDSGIPYHYFHDQPWRVQLFGDYVRPYGSFRWLEQPDLRKAYAEPDRKPLNFQIGYGFRRIPSNLLFASKTAPTRKD